MNIKFCFLEDGKHIRVNIKNTTSVRYLEEAIRTYQNNIEDMESKIKYCKLKINQLENKKMKGDKNSKENQQLEI